MTTYAEELAYYEAKVDDLRRGQLKAVQTSATRWSALMAGLLGVFGTVAFAGGLTTVDKLPSPADAVVRAFTTAAAVAAVLALWFLARAAGGLRLTDIAHPNGKTLMAREAELAGQARRAISTGKVFALVTTGLVLAGSVVVLWTPEQKADQKYLIRFPDAAACGALKRDGARLVIGGRAVSEAVEIDPVAACPR